MLHTETIEPGTLSILKRLMEIDALENFALVGGTALALLYGHRKSEDLDLFSTLSFDSSNLLIELEESFGSSFENRTANPKFGIFGFINQIKVDFVHFPHPLIRPEQEIEKIRMYSIQDIIAMKVQAVLGRAQKKDFWDIAELLNHFTIEDFIRFHKKKFATQNLLITVPQALTYFADAEDSVEPVSKKNQNWDMVKKNIKDKVREYLI